MDYIAKNARRAIALVIALLTLGFAVLPTSVAHAEDGGKVNTGG
jgi:hypothetical protein